MKRDLSKQEYSLLSELALQQRKFVTPSEAAEILDTTLDNTYRILSRLHKKGWLERIKRGIYLIVPLEGQLGWAEHEFVYASKLVSPYYISYRTALSYWGLTEQLPRVVFIATTKRHRNLEFQGTLFQFVAVHPRKFFGYQTVTINGVEIQVADPEKTIIDCLDQEAYSGGIVEISKALLEGRQDLDPEKLSAYALQMGSRALIRRLGYLLDLLEMGNTRQLLTAVDHNGHAFLSTIYPKEVYTISHRWNLRVNVRERDLLRGREIL